MFYFLSELSKCAEAIIRLQKDKDTKSLHEKISIMSKKIFSYSFLILLTGASSLSVWDYYSELSHGEIKKVNRLSTLNDTVRYCYHFTWMGSKFNNGTFKTIRNKTCSQYFKDKKTLCINPMVATFTGGKPDLGYILKNFAREATCRMSGDHTCVKYVVYYNGIISYETRYCSIVNIDNEGPMKTGCIQEKRGSETIEVCACRSQPGSEGICNSSSPIFISKFLILTVLLHLSILLTF